ncbi:Ketosteroid isomerase homolog [Mucilaginibacter sp. OK268]|uniref:YybH family protein n=1 Tax=Mucilaginibacter sp. OK268 TaxID=1881048 RepID=UPI00088C81BF|nr:nuclear transport factor 2 family protein [Mucilaginibacter sp. OK268]SDP29809.1 Ketosteroid isomerase homolog [Mucilaginibacter sp. OK268]
MTNKSWLLTLTIFYLLFSGGQQALAQNADIGKVKAALTSVNTNYGQAFAKGDSSLFLNSYTADACLLPANSPTICGQQGQLAFFKFAYRSGVRNIIFNTLDLYGLTDEYVTEQGNYEMFGANNNTLGKGKYLVLWKKTSGGWKMFRDMFNSNTPAVR